jgi:hypothetical protein
LEETTLPANTILATVDVRSLYLHITHEDGIKIALDNLFSGDAKPLPFNREFAESLLTAILKHNIFEFNSNMYRQIKGTAMGTKMAPAYATLFLNKIETIPGDYNQQYGRDTSMILCYSGWTEYCLSII